MCGGSLSVPCFRENLGQSQWFCHLTDPVLITPTKKEGPCDKEFCHPGGIECFFWEELWSRYWLLSQPWKEISSQIICLACVLVSKTAHSGEGKLFCHLKEKKVPIWKKTCVPAKNIYICGYTHIYLYGYMHMYFDYYLPSVKG